MVKGYILNCHETTLLHCSTMMLMMLLLWSGASSETLWLLKTTAVNHHLSKNCNPFTNFLLSMQGNPRTHVFFSYTLFQSSSAGNTYLINSGHLYVAEDSVFKLKDL